MKEYNGPNKYYAKYRKEILENNKKKRLLMSKEQKEKTKLYNKNYYHNKRKLKFANDLKNTGTNYMKEYYNKNKKIILNKNDINLNIKKEKTILNFN